MLRFLCVFSLLLFLESTLIKSKHGQRLVVKNATRTSRCQSEESAQHCLNYLINDKEMGQCCVDSTNRKLMQQFQTDIDMTFCWR